MSRRSIFITLGVLALSETARSNQLRGYLRNDRHDHVKPTSKSDENFIPFDNDEKDAKSVAVKKGQARIVGGTTAPIQPNFVMNLAITENGFKFGGCGGTLISRCHVLTAAHCVTESGLNAANALYINAYKPSANNDQIPFHFSSVGSITVHPNYDSEWSSTNDDIAVIGLSSCVDEHPFKEFFLQSIMRLADYGFMVKMYEGRPVRLSGFGRKSQDPGSTFSSVLQSVEVPYISNEMCKERFYGEHLHRDEVCAGRWDGGKDACQGDSGGPMFVEEGNVQTQIGVISWGQGCGKPKKPGVYASVAFHHSFIMDVVCETLNTEEICKNHPSYVPLTPSPSRIPSAAPFESPSEAPSSDPSQSFAPSDSPSANPSSIPSAAPSTHSNAPSVEPSHTSSEMPSEAPSVSPSKSTLAPSDSPSVHPSSSASAAPSATQSNVPSVTLLQFSSETPPGAPSVAPFTNTSAPSDSPSLTPSVVPSDMPSLTPSTQPPVSESRFFSEIMHSSSEPIDAPTSKLSQSSSEMPSGAPSIAPSKSILAPSDSSSLTPSVVPSDMPSLVPSQFPVSESRLSPEIVDSSPIDAPTSKPSKFSSGFLIRPANAPQSCRGICYEPWSFSMKNPNETVILPNGTEHPCFLIDSVLKMQQEDTENNLCIKQALEARNAGCKCE